MRLSQKMVLFCIGRCIATYNELKMRLIAPNMLCTQCLKSAVFLFNKDTKESDYALNA